MLKNRPLVTVGGLIVAHDKDILLVRSEKWLNLYSVPGGKVEWGETREEAFRREVWEETRLKLADVYFVMVQDCIFSSEFWHKNHFVMNDFIGYLHSDYQKEDVVLNNEAYEYVWTSPKQALILPMHHECLMLIQWYLEHAGLKKEKTLGIIGVQHHKITCTIGINPEERIQEQTIYIDIKVKADFSSCVVLDKIEATVNYVELAEKCTQLAQEKKYYLLETFACEAIDYFMQKFPVEWAWMRIKKPAALASAEYTMVEFERYKEKE